MASRYVAFGSLALSVTLAAASAVPAVSPKTLRAAAAGSARLVVVGSRSAEQRQSATASKLDSVLADLSRHAARARPGHILEDLHSLSPPARFTAAAATGAPLVLIDAVTRGDPEQLKAALLGLGLQRAAVYLNDVGGWLPVDRIDAAAARAEVHSIRAAMPHTRVAGPVALQGDYVQRSDVVRTTYPTLSGTGITVGVLSDSFNCYAVYAVPANNVPVSGNAGYASNGFTADYTSDVSTGALPSGVNVLAGGEADCLNYGAPTQLPFGDEGRAMLQIVHAVAPGASLAFYTAQNSEADFAGGIGKLATAGARVIADDVGYFDEPYYQDGLVAQAIDAVEAKGVAYFSAAGNNGTLSYENTAPSFATLSSSAPTAGEYLLNFDTSGTTTTNYLPITVPPIPPGAFVAVFIEWDQPYVTGASGSPGASSEIDLCITGGTGSDTITDNDGNAVSCTGPNKVGADAYQLMFIGNPANASGRSAQQNLDIVVGLAGGTTAPGRLIVTVEDDGLGSTINQFSTGGATLQGHPGAAGAAAVGAAFYFTTPRCGSTPAQLEFFSSAGGAPILFNTSGVRLAAPVVRLKPDFVGPDGVNDTFLGYTLASAGVTGSNGQLMTTTPQCQNDASYPNFFGTSAATPHAAGIAALMLQSNSAVTPGQIYTALQKSALPMTGATPNYDSGYGFIQADAALALIAPGAPTLTLGVTSVAAGSSTTITWSSVNTTGCTASGSWSGALASDGNQTVTPAAAGTDSYTLTCANAAGSSTPVSASLSVTAAPSGGGGGGAIGAWSLWGLVLLAAARTRRAIFRRLPPNRG
jgi:hypothetical protein